jgi:hypothetical protein
MREWLLQNLLGIPFQQGAHIVDVHTAFRGAIGTGTVILIGIALAAIVGWMYHLAASHLQVWRRYALAIFRIAFLLLLLLLLKRPVIQFTLEGSVRRTLLLLVDGTRSMTIPEERTEAADLKRAGIANAVLDPTKGLDQSLNSNAIAGLAHMTRLQIIQSVLQNDKLKLIKSLSGDFDVTAYRFGQANAADAQLHDAGQAVTSDAQANPVVDLAWAKSLTADAPSTAIGDAIHDALARTRGQPLAGIWLITDGQNNSGASIATAAQDARAAGVPIFAYGVGLKLPKDVIVSRPFAPDIAFVNDEVPVTVRVRSQGLAGQSGQLTLKLGDQEVDHAEVKFGADDEAIVPVKFTPQSAGEYDLSAEIPPRSDEAVTTNNRGVTHLRVVDGKIKVLCIEQYPRWEFKYLQAILMRDRRLSVNFVLAEGDPDIALGKDSPFLPAIPTNREDLLKYDMIIVGDVDPKLFSSDQMSTISDFVTKFGGGLVSIAGRRFNPAAYRETPFEKMLPIDLSSLSASMAGPTGTAIRLQPTDSGKRSPMLKFSDDKIENDLIWKDKLAPIYWDVTSVRAKPAADVLVVDPDSAKESKYGKLPVIALQQYGVGQVLYVGTDNLWRWRKNNGEAYYQAFWSQAVQRLALPHLLGGSKRVQLLADKESYSTGEKMTIDARVYDKSFQPVNEKTVDGFLESDKGERSQISMRPVPDQPGNYRAQFVAPPPGHYKFFIDRASDVEAKKTQLDLIVTEPRLELDETAMNETALREAASLSGGQFYREEDLYKFPDAVKAHTEHVQSTVDAEIWCSPAVFILMMLILIAEWILRKLCQLK